MIHTSSPVRQRGSALVPALLFAITVMAFAMSVVTSGIAVNGQRRSLVAAQRAQDAAESGIHHLLGALAGPGRFRVLADRRLEGVMDGDDESEAARRYEITLAPAGKDECDNDLDGLVDEEDEKDMYEATSTGRADRIAKTTRVTLLARYRAPTMPSAAYIADPLADLRFAGNAFVISGKDLDLNGAATGELVPGIGVRASVGRPRETGAAVAIPVARSSAASVKRQESTLPPRPPPSGRGATTRTPSGRAASPG